MYRSGFRQRAKMKIAIIGGGIVGLATAYQLLNRFPSTTVTLLEKEAGAGRHQTGHNSGVLHCGLFYKPGSSKARLAVQGIRRLTRFCAEHGVRYELCGKVVVATGQREIPRLHTLLERGTANGLTGLRLLDPEQIRELEPHAAGLAGLHVPEEGIVDYGGVTESMVREITRLGGDIKFSSEVMELRDRNGWHIRTSGGDLDADFLINCAGLQSDRVSHMAGNRDAVKIVPFRGEYYQLKKNREHLVRNLLYPVPDPAFPFLGVHFTRMIRGGVEAGPNAVLALAREAYGRTDYSVRDMVETFTYRGFWRFLVRYPAMCWQELKSSVSKQFFCRLLQRLVPEIQVDDLVKSDAGVRAQALSPSGELLQDFCIVRQERALHVLNAPSPGATACLAIADEVIDRIRDAIGRIDGERTENAQCR
jgi:L-2-hydroxyglutarate oxidase